MSFTTLNMGLIAWDAGSDPYDHAQLANNFIRLDDHDHTPGKGHALPEQGLRDRSVTEIKIALQAVGTPEIMDGAVTQSKIAVNSIDSSRIIDGAVGTSEIANGAVTSAKIDPTFLPLGTVLMWGLTDRLPGGGWEVCDGRPWNAVSNAFGYTTGNMPDLRNRFPLGAVTSGTGTTPDFPPAIQQKGGSNTLSINHWHQLPDHTHAVPDHSHTIASDGSHQHQWLDDDNHRRNLYTRHVGVGVTEGIREALYVPDQHSTLDPSPTPPGGSTPSKELPMTNEGSHNHGSTTGGAPGLHTGTIDGDFQYSSGMIINGTVLSDGIFDSRPQYTGLLFIMRVR